MVPERGKSNREKEDASLGVAGAGLQLPVVGRKQKAPHMGWGRQGSPGNSHIIPEVWIGQAHKEAWGCWDLTGGLQPSGVQRLPAAGSQWSREAFPLPLTSSSAGPDRPPHRKTKSSNGVFRMGAAQGTAPGVSTAAPASGSPGHGGGPPSTYPFPFVRMSFGGTVCSAC